MISSSCISSGALVNVIMQKTDPLHELIACAVLDRVMQARPRPYRLLSTLMRRLHKAAVLLCSWRAGPAAAGDVLPLRPVPAAALRALPEPRGMGIAQLCCLSIIGGKQYLPYADRVIAACHLAQSARTPLTPYSAAGSWPVREESAGSALC